MQCRRKPKKFSEKFRNLKALIARDYPIIILAIALAIALHLYVKYEKAQTTTPKPQELKVPR